MSESTAEPLASSTGLLNTNGRRLRIIGDGTPDGTQVIDVATGEPLAGVLRVEVSAAVGQHPIRARITVEAVEIDLDVMSDVVPS